MFELGRSHKLMGVVDKIKNDTPYTKVSPKVNNYLWIMT
jgi:hypothetical protein